MAFDEQQSFVFPENPVVTWRPVGSYPRPAEASEDTSTLLPFDEYDYIIVSFSGGKDSIACVLHLLDLGISRDRIELWHQCVDGEPGVAERFFDWPCTEAYCQAFADALGLRLLFQWKEDGFKGEMLRDDALTKPTTFELLDGSRITSKTIKRADYYNTRMRFPMPSMDLSARWCSAALKIDVASKVFTNDPRFTGTVDDPATAVIITGECREEGGSIEKIERKIEIAHEKGQWHVDRLKGRAFYAYVDRHKATTKSGTRRIDQWRPILDWMEEEVWDIIRRYRVRPHPAYYLGWSRLSCMPCVFGNPDQFASVAAVDPELAETLTAYENEFGAIPRYNKDTGKRVPFAGTIRDGSTVLEAAAEGRSSLRAGDEPVVELAMGEEYPTDLVLLQPGEEWVMPRGSFKHSGGPT
jgi:3'-phosphoadenosine 5'-phosphosulfate sulfotransferase (PAPS reductase)/FAD synthetase